MEMQTSIAAAFATTVQECPDWLKTGARATFLLLVVKGVAWLAASWLAFRGFSL